MPNITGGGLFAENGITNTTYGACVLWANGNQGKAGSKGGFDTDNANMGINAANSNNIYGNSTTVTPLSQMCCFIIRY